jgi:hypothetical protein
MNCTSILVLEWRRVPNFCFYGRTLCSIEQQALQDVIQASGAHSSFGKYTLFLAYAMTANGNMSPLAFGLLSGNKVINNWLKF